MKKSFGWEKTNSSKKDAAKYQVRVTDTLAKDQEGSQEWKLTKKIRRMKVSDMSDCNQMVKRNHCRSVETKSAQRQEIKNLLQKEMPEKRPKSPRCQEIKFKEPKLRKLFRTVYNKWKSRFRIEDPRTQRKEEEGSLVKLKKRKAGKFVRKMILEEDQEKIKCEIQSLWKKVLESWRTLKELKERQDTLERRLKYDENKREIARKIYEPKEEGSKGTKITQALVLTNK